MRTPRFLLLLALLAASGSAAEHALVVRDIEYGRADGVSLRLDAGLPPGEGTFPVVIFVHGGGWSGGDKSGSDKPGSSADITPWFDQFTAAGYLWFSLNYRMAPAHLWPACIEDVYAAIRWVKAHAADYRGDPTRIVIVGHSAGGHLALYAATSDDPSVRVQAALGYAPVTDLEFDSQVRGGLSLSLQRLFARPAALTPEARAFLRPLSPINRVRPGLPPMLLVQGDADKTVPPAMSQAFLVRMREKGNTCDLLTLPGAQHGLLPWTQTSPDYPRRVADWLRVHLRAETPR